MLKGAMYFMVNIFSILVVSVILMQPMHAQAAVTSFGAPIIDAADQGNEYVVANLLKGGKSSNTRGRFGVTPLMRATLKGHTATVKMLLNAGANPNIKDVGGATALHLAARTGKSEIVKILLSYGAQSDAVDLQSYTPLMRAVSKGDVGSVKQMIKKGANLDLLNKYNTSARQMIHDSRNKNLKKIMTVNAENNDSGLHIADAAKKSDGVVIKENTLGKLKSENRVEKLDYKERTVTGDLVRDLNSYIRDPEQSFVKEEYFDDGDEDEIVDAILADSSHSEVKVAEAIKLPDGLDMSDPNNKLVVRDTVKNLGDGSQESVNNQYVAAGAIASKQYWMEISGFDDELEALNFWQKASRDATFKKLDAKLLDQDGPSMSKVLRFGKFSNSGDVFQKCKKAKKLNSKVICYVINN